MSDQLRDLVRPVGEFDPPLDLPARINARERELAPGRRPARVPRTLVRIAAVAGALLILGVLALAAHSREQTAKPAKSTFPAHIVLDKATHCNIRFGAWVWFRVGLRNTGDVDRVVKVLPWWRLSDGGIGYAARGPFTVNVPAHTTKLFHNSRAGHAQGAGREFKVNQEAGPDHLLHAVGCGVILDNDFDHLHPLRITHNSSITSG